MMNEYYNDEFEEYTKYITKKFEKNPKLENKLSDALDILSNIYEKPIRYEIILDNETDSILELYDIRDDIDIVKNIQYIENDNIIQFDEFFKTLKKEEKDSKDLNVYIHTKHLKNKEMNGICKLLVTTINNKIILIPKNE